MKKKIIWLILLILWIGFIFFNSLQPANKSSEASGIFVTIAFKIFSMVNFNINISLLATLIRKGAHFFEYFLLFIFSYNFLKYFNIFENTKKLYKNVSIYTYLFSLLLCLLVACFDETIQLFIEGRHGSIFDVLLDFSGSLSSLILIILINLKKIKSHLNNFS